LQKYEHRRENQVKSFGPLELRVFVRRAAVERRKNKMPVMKVKGGYSAGGSEGGVKYT